MAQHPAAASGRQNAVRAFQLELITAILTAGSHLESRGVVQVRACGLQSLHLLHGHTVYQLCAITAVVHACKWCLGVCSCRLGNRMAWLMSLTTSVVGMPAAASIKILPGR